jgi:hypothetical protein
MRKTVAAMIGAAVALGAGPALAQATFGPQGTAAFSGDRLFGFYSVNVEVEPPAPSPSFEYEYTTFGIAWQGPNHRSPYTVPRLSFDYFVIDSLSIGGSIAYASFDEDEPGNDDDDDSSAFLFAPRVGYVWMFSDVIGFWLRGGFTYHSYDDEGVIGDFEEHAFALTVDPVFVITPVTHFGFVVGPLLDVSITGERESGGVDADISYTNFGIAAGVIGWF